MCGLELAAHVGQVEVRGECPVEVENQGFSVNEIVHPGCLDTCLAKGFGVVSVAGDIVQATGR